MKLRTFAVTALISLGLFAVQDIEAHKNDDRPFPRSQTELFWWPKL